MNHDKIDEIKNYWNQRPCNINHSKKELGTKEYFEEVEKRKYTVEPHIPDFAKFDFWKGKKVLEIGSGIGTDSINFAKSGANITCVELSDKSLEICKKRFEVYNLKANFYNCDAEHLSEIVPVEEYDLIYSFGVIHHTPKPEKVIQEIKKYMGSKTEVRIMLYSKYSWKTFEFFILNGYKFGFNLKKTIQYYAEAQLNCPIAYVYTEKEIKNLLKDFEIIDIKKDHIFPYIIGDYINHIYKKRLIFKLLPKKVFNILKKNLGWHYLIKFKNI